jgi:hypothetical protein
MNEAITVAQVRKARTIQVKPGDWVILSNPSRSFTEANAAFDKASGPVSEDYSQLIIGKIQHTRPAKFPVTQKAFEERIEAQTERTKEVQDIAASARNRQIEREEKAKQATKDDLAAHRAKAQEIVDKVRKSHATWIEEKQTTAAKTQPEVKNV